MMWCCMHMACIKLRTSYIYTATPGKTVHFNLVKHHDSILGQLFTRVLCFTVHTLQ